MSDPNTLDGALEWLAASNFRAKVMAAYGNGEEAHRIFPAIHPHVPALMTVADHADELATLRTRLAEVEAENERLREIGRKASVALSLVMSLDFDDDADQWADARMKCDNAAASLRDALAQNKESSHDG